MKIVKITKLSGENSNIRDGSSIEGPESSPPQVGHTYYLEGYLGDNTGKSWHGFFHTGKVRAINHNPDGAIGLMTINSIYEIKYLG